MCGSSRGGRIRGRGGAEVRGRPAAAVCGDLNQQVPGSASGGGVAGLVPSPTRCSLGPGPNPGLLVWLPQAAGAVSGRGGREPNLCPSGDAAWPCPLPLLWQGTTSAGAAARPARVAGDTAGSPLPSASPAPGFAAPGTPSKAGRGKSVGRTLSFRRPNVVSVPLPDSAPGIPCLLRSLNK